MSVRVKFILDRDEDYFETVAIETSMQAVPRAGEVVWFTEEAHVPAWRVEWVRHVIGIRGGDLVEIKIQRWHRGREGSA